jgi:hypothetical protein
MFAHTVADGRCYVCCSTKQRDLEAREVRYIHGDLTALCPRFQHTQAATKTQSSSCKRRWVKSLQYTLKATKTAAVAVSAHIAASIAGPLSPGGHDVGTPFSSYVQPLDIVAVETCQSSKMF